MGNILNKEIVIDILIKNIKDYISFNELYRLVCLNKMIAKIIVLNLDSNVLKRCIRKCCSDGYIRMLKILLEHPNISPEDYETFHGDAFMENQVDIVHLFLQRGFFSPTYGDNYPLLWACCEGHYDFAKILLQDPEVDPNNYLQNGNILAYACAEGHTDIVKLLLRCRKVDTTLGTYKAIRWAICRGRADISILLFEYDNRNIEYIKNNTILLIGSLIQYIEESIDFLEYKVFKMPYLDSDKEEESQDIKLYYYNILFIEIQSIINNVVKIGKYLKNWNINIFTMELFAHFFKEIIKIFSSFKNKVWWYCDPLNDKDYFDIKVLVHEICNDIFY